MHKRQIEQKVPLATPHFNVHNLSRSCADAIQASKHDYAYRISADQKQINLPFYAMTEYSTGGFCFYIDITVFDRVTKSNRLLDPFKEYMLIIMSFFFNILGMESKISTVVKKSMFGTMKSVFLPSEINGWWNRIFVKKKIIFLNFLPELWLIIIIIIKKNCSFQWVILDSRFNYVDITRSY